MLEKQYPSVQILYATKWLHVNCDKLDLAYYVFEDILKMSSQLIAFYNGFYALAAATISIFYIVGFLAVFFAPVTNGETAGTMLLKKEIAPLL